MKDTRFPQVAGLLAAALIAMPTTLIAEESKPPVREIRVDIDFARIIRLPEGARTLVLGNPLIADATLLRADGLVVVTGKSFGSTNLLMLDAEGARVAEAILTVTPANNGLVVFRGPGRRESLSCDPDCVRAVQLGDDPEFFESGLKAVESHRAAAASAGVTKTPGQ